MTESSAETSTTSPAPAKKPASDKQLAARQRFKDQGKAFREWQLAQKEGRAPAERPTPPPAPRSSPPAPASPSGASSPPAGSPPAPVPRVKDWIDGIGLNDVLGWTRKIEVPGLKFGKRD